MSAAELVQMVTGVVLAGVVTAVTWLVRGVITHGKQIAAIETALAALPDKDGLHQLALVAAKLEGGLATLNERTLAMTRILDRHERYQEQARRG